MTNVDNKITNYFRTIISSSLNRNYYYTQLSSLLSTLTNYANGVKNEAKDCCKWEKKVFYKRWFSSSKYVCTRHNPQKVAQQN